MLGNPNTPQGERSLEDTEEERRGGVVVVVEEMGTKEILFPWTVSQTVLGSLVTWDSAAQGPAVLEMVLAEWKELSGGVSQPC